MKEFVKAFLLMLLMCVGVGAQTPVVPAPAAQAPTTEEPVAAEPIMPKGQVLFQSHGEAPTPSAEPGRVALPTQTAGPEVTDDERSAVVFTAYDLDARLMPETAGLAMRARLTVRNDGAGPLRRIALQVSSTLRWESATLVSAFGNKRLAVEQHLLDTDADHTGKANEMVVTLPEALAAGKSVTLDVFYSGTIPASAERLERIGATHPQALATDWDVISAKTALRGFGNVLWYPVAAKPLFLGEGAQLFEAVGATKLREAAAMIRLRLSVAYRGDPPTAAYFCGRRQALKAISDDDNMPISEGSGVATADFAAEALGFRMPSLFVVERPESVMAPAETAAGTSLLAVESDDATAMPALTAAVEHVAPLLQDWFGARPLSVLTILDHAGEPFEDGPLLVGPAASLAASTAEPALIHSLTHAWVQSGRPWMDEGLAQFLSLLWTEREKGREAAIAELDALVQPLAIAEPEILSASAEAGGQPLIAATSDLYYRRKAAAVWWMLRDIAGEDVLQTALEQWHLLTAKTAEQDAVDFETLLEHAGPKNSVNPIDLRWFFDAWVLRDRGLPDLSIVDVTPRLLPAGQGHTAGWLVAVTVKNDGAAAAEVPLTIRGAGFSTTSRMRVAGFASATARVLLEAAPKEVLVNDGSVPEVRTSFHKLDVTIKRQ